MKPLYKSMVVYRFCKFSTQGSASCWDWVFLTREHPTTDPFPAQIQSSQTPKNCSHISGPFLSKCSFAPRKSCHVVVYQVLLDQTNVLSKSMTGKDGSRSLWIGKETIMKFLLTSSGISNNSIRNALVDLLGKPIAESSALCIPTAAYACPGGAAMA